MGERWDIGLYKLRRCPVKVVTNDGLEYMTAYKFYKQGQLPMAGGWMDQAQPFLEAMEVIDEQVANIEAEVKKGK